MTKYHPQHEELSGLLREDPPPYFVWTLARYHEAIEKGVLTENDRVELLFGEIVLKMPTGEPHADCLSMLMDYFYQLFGTRYKYRAQDPITLPNESEPEPDFAVVTRQPYTRSSGHPSPDDIFLVIEISEETLRYDRGKKCRAYALAGIREYWIINLKDRQIEVHLDPNPTSGQYDQVQHFSAGENMLSELCGSIDVSTLLPIQE